jgi:hypothetical protein
MDSRSVHFVSARKAACTVSSRTSSIEVPRGCARSLASLEGSVIIIRQPEVGFGRPPPFLYFSLPSAPRSLCVSTPYTRHVCEIVPPHNTLEIMEHILTLLAADGEPHAIAALAATCRLLYNIVYGSPNSHLWREIYLTTFDDPRPARRIVYRRVSTMPFGHISILTTSLYRGSPLRLGRRV